MTDPRIPHPDEVPYDDVGNESYQLPQPGVLEIVITELLGALPEVRNHVLEAADALLDAGKALLDAAERIVDTQRDPQRGGEG